MGFAWGVMLSQCLGTCDLRCLLGDLIVFLLGDEFFEWFAWGCGFQGLLCLGTSILAPLLLGDLLGVDLLGSVRQGCSMCLRRVRPSLSSWPKAWI